MAAKETLHPRLPLDVLWLEDDPGFAAAGRLLLERGPEESERGHPPFDATVRPAVTLGDALRALEDRVPDVLLVDLNVPDSKGPATLLRLREAAPHVALVVLTAVDDEDASMLAALENADFLCKDELDPRRLWRSITMAMTRTGTRSE